MTLQPSTLAEPTTWDLERLFPGGPEGEAFTHALHAVEADLSRLRAQVQALGPLADAPDAWVATLTAETALRQQVRAVMSYATCRYAANTAEPAARVARERALRSASAVDQISVGILAGLDEASDPVFAAFIGRDDLADHRDLLVHDRRRRGLRLPRREQALVAALRPHALGGWGSAYTELAGGLTSTIELPEHGRVQRSVGQLQTYRSSPDAVLRERAHLAGQEAWDSVAPACARALGHITGARAALNAHRGVDELADTCGRNRVERSTVDALWAASDHALPRLQAYLARKAELAGLERLSFWDLRAPTPQPGQDAGVAWGDACSWIIEAFEAFDPQMAEFAVRALDRRWIEAADRPNKRAGGFCSRAGHGESRIFMTWAGTMGSVFTLAHELGHAWHNEVLFRQSPARRAITSATAETASTLAEALVRDLLLKRAEDPAVRISMLDQQGLSGVGLLLDVRARYLFERELYRLHAKGPLTPAVLDSAMIQAQQSAFGAATLGGWDRTFWASKLHFYIAGFGFYNWPYAFGYLFSQAVFAQSLAEGPAYASTVQQLLSETGYMWTEDVGHKVLGADLGKPEFWIDATRPLLAAVDAFLDETG